MEIAWGYRCPQGGSNPFYAQADKETYFSGHGVWRLGEVYVYEGSNQVDDDGQFFCNGLANTYYFNGNTFNWDGAPYTEITWSSGSNCTSFDTFQNADYGWYQDP